MNNDFTEQNIDMIREYARKLLEVRYSDQYRDFITVSDRAPRHRADPDNDPWLNEFLLAEASAYLKQHHKTWRSHSNRESGDHRFISQYAIVIVASMWRCRNIDFLILGEELGIDEIFAEFETRYQSLGKGPSSDERDQAGEV